MSELDRLESFTRQTTRQVLAPDFDALVTTSRRRRRVSVTLVAGASAAVLGIVAIGVQAVGQDQSGPVHPAPTATTTTALTKEARAAAAIVDDPRAQHRSIAVLPDHPDTRAVVWRVSNRRVALAVTSDGFATRACLLLRGPYPAVSAVGPTGFFVQQRGVDLLVAPDGSTREVAADPRPQPLTDGEYLALRNDGADLAVNPGAATSHALELPPHASTTFGSERMLWSIPTRVSTGGVVSSAVAWSTDGGRSWSSHRLPSGPNAYFSAVPSDDETMAVSETGDGNTITPLSRLVVSQDYGASWRTVTMPGAATAGVTWTAALPDGRLLAYVLAWSDQRAGHASEHPTGLMASIGADWTHLMSIHPRFPGSDLETTSMNGNAMELFVSSGPNFDLLRSADGGESWSLARAR